MGTLRKLWTVFGTLLFALVMEVAKVMPKKGGGGKGLRIGIFGLNVRRRAVMSGVLRIFIACMEPYRHTLIWLNKRKTYCLCLSTTKYCSGGWTVELAGPAWNPLRPRPVGCPGGKFRLRSRNFGGRGWNDVLKTHPSTKSRYMAGFKRRPMPNSVSKRCPCGGECVRTRIHQDSDGSASFTGWAGCPWPSALGGERAMGPF